MNQDMKKQLAAHYLALERIQADIEQILSLETAYKKTLQKRSEAYEQSDLICDSLGYAVDDLDSLLGNLEELVKTDTLEEN